MAFNIHINNWKESHFPPDGENHFHSAIKFPITVLRGFLLPVITSSFNSVLLWSPPFRPSSLLKISTCETQRELRLYAAVMSGRLRDSIRRRSKEKKEMKEERQKCWDGVERLSAVFLCVYGMAGVNMVDLCV